MAIKMMHSKTCGMQLKMFFLFNLTLWFSVQFKKL